MQKLISVLCVILLFTSVFMAMPIYAAENDYQDNLNSYAYQDIDSGDWFYEAAVRAKELNIMTGMSQKNFEPDTLVTREMFLTALERMKIHNGISFSTFSAFSDIKEDKYYTKAVKWAEYNGITKGISASEFGIGLNVTRQQIVTFIYRYLQDGYIKINLKPAQSPAAEFFDRPSEYAKEAVDYMRSTGIIDGMGDGKFEPDAPATRAQIAAMLVRLYDAMRNADFEFNISPNISKIEVVHQIPDPLTGQIPKSRFITDSSEIADIINQINSTHITSGTDIELTVGWEYVARFSDKQGKIVFDVMFTESYIKESNFRFETNAFERFITFINNN